jgi:diguanylate cyclase (GGDEF)-like protein
MKMKNRHEIEPPAGLTSCFLWRMATAMWLALGLVQIASYVFTLTPIRLPVICLVLGGIVPVVLAGVWFWCSRHDVPLEPWFHFQSALGFIAIIVVSLMDVNDHSADAVYPMLPMIVGAMVFPPSRSAFYVVAGAMGSAAMVLLGDDEFAGQRAFVVSLIAVTVGVIVMAVQIQLRNALAYSRELSEKDELTGLANMRRFRQRLEEIFDRDRRHGFARVALLTIDLDGFKQTNDQHSHSAGDSILVLSAHAIEACVQKSDLVACRGGDEFVVLAFELPGRSVERLADEIAFEISCRRKAAFSDVTSTASVGMVWHEPGETVERLLARADFELHRRKELSRLTEDGADTDSANFLNSLADIDENLRRFPEEPGPMLRGTDGDTLRQGQGVRRRVYRSQDAGRFAWILLALYLLVLGVTVPVLGFFGHDESVSRPTIIALGYLAVIGAGVCFQLGQRDLHVNRRTGLMVLGLSLTVVMTVFLVAQSGSARGAMVEFLICPAVIACYAVDRRLALAYATICMSAYVFFLSTLNYESTLIRSVQTIAVVALLAVAIPRGLKRSADAWKENQRLSGIDPLTGLANMRRLVHRLNDELARASAMGEQVSLLAIDLDNFKLVNDRFGHSRGDEVLIAVARALKREVRTYDLVARRGGDEFMILLVDHSADVAGLVDRLGDAIIKARQEICADVSPTASIGVVTSLPGESVESVIARADADELRVKVRSRDGHRLEAVA